MTDFVHLEGYLWNLINIPLFKNRSSIAYVTKPDWVQIHPLKDVYLKPKLFKSHIMMCF